MDASQSVAVKHGRDSVSSGATRRAFMHLELGGAWRRHSLGKIRADIGGNSRWLLLPPLTPSYRNTDSFYLGEASQGFQRLSKNH